MLLKPIFERFAQWSPISVMVRGLLERALCPQRLDDLFAASAELQYTRTLLFSTVVDLMTAVVCRVRPSVHAAYQASRAEIGVSIKSVYNKLEHVEPPVSAELVRHTARQMEPVIEGMDGKLPPLVPGYEARILDGNHLAGTEHRLAVLRPLRAGALPGHTLVVLDPATMLAMDVFLCEDGHAQERTMLDAVLETIRARQVWIADRNFCTTRFLFGIAARGGFFVIRQHASTLHWQREGRQRKRGRVEGGTVREQGVCLTDDEGHTLRIRRVTLVLDHPTRDGEKEIHLLTNVPEEDADARRIAEVYRKRWTIEGLFQDMTTLLKCEVNTLGYPKAALFGFCVALAASNVLAATRAALRAEHGQDKVQKEVSNFYLADEIAGTYRGMMIAIPEPEWKVFRGITIPELAALLKQLAGKVRLAAFRKHPRGPKKPRLQRQSGAKQKHVSTARLLKVKGRRE